MMRKANDGHFPREVEVVPRDAVLRLRELENLDDAPFLRHAKKCLHPGAPGYPTRFSGDEGLPRRHRNSRKARGGTRRDRDPGRPQCPLLFFLPPPAANPGRDVRPHLKGRAAFAMAAAAARSAAAAATAAGKAAAGPPGAPGPVASAGPAVAAAAALLAKCSWDHVGRDGSASERAPSGAEHRGGGDGGGGVDGNGRESGASGDGGEDDTTDSEEVWSGGSGGEWG
ncbi:unnamed protein product, partial [Phaeothamnion confervicola]